MLYSVIIDIILCVAASILSVVLMSSPYNYIVVGLCVIAIIIKSIWLKELIEEIRESMPKKRKTRKKPVDNRNKRKLVTTILMEILIGLMLWIMHTNGLPVTVVWVIVGVTIAAIVGILLP